MKIKKNKKALNLSKRKFNIFFLINILFFSLYGNSLASKKNLKGILEITNEKLVSVDFNHNSHSAIVDATLTNVIGKNMGKILAWYDNEWGFSSRMCDITQYLHKISR